MVWMAFVAAVAASDGYVDRSPGGEDAAALVAPAGAADPGPSGPVGEPARGAASSRSLLASAPTSEVAGRLFGVFLHFAFASAIVAVQYVGWSAVMGFVALPMLLIESGGRRRCPRCRRPRQALSGDAADAALSEAQRVELRLGSVVHEVLACPHHPEPVVVSRVRSSPYRTCRACKARAVAPTVGGAPDDAGAPAGRWVATFTCAHCGVVTHRR